MTGKNLFERLGQLPELDPLRQPFRRWVYRLAEQRINHAPLVEQAAAWNESLELRDSPSGGRVSPRQMLAGLLGDAPRRDAWAQALMAHVARCSRASVTLWQRRREIARRMGLDGPDAIETPGLDVAPTAMRFQRSMRDRVHELGATTLSAYVTQALASDAPGEWPARLTPARMLDAFRDGDLMRSLELRQRRLPAALGAASYCRALGVLGAEWLEAQAPNDQPFVIAHDPYGLARHSAGALFAFLPLSPAFLTRKLAVPRARLRDAQRCLARAALLELSSTALRVRLRQPALDGERELREAFSGACAEELGLALPSSLAGCLFRLDVEDPQRWVGALTASLTDARLCREHDEDWFRNPRAIEQLRAEARLPPPTRVGEQELDGALETTLARLDALLD